MEMIKTLGKSIQPGMDPNHNNHQESATKDLGSFVIFSKIKYTKPTIINKSLKRLKLYSHAYVYNTVKNRKMSGSLDRASIATQFRRLPNFHECFYNVCEHGKKCFLSLL